MTPLPCACGIVAAGLVVEGRMHPYCAWQAERARAERLITRLDALAAAHCVIVGPTDETSPFMDAYLDAGGGYEGLQAVSAAALAADREGRP